MKKNKLPSLVTIMILTQLTSILWICLNVYWAFTKKPELVVPESVSNPITVTLDQTAINKIESEIFFDSSQIPEIVTTTTSSPLPTSKPQATPVASPSATPEVP